MPRKKSDAAPGATAPNPVALSIDISVEAGGWADERDLETLVKAAAAATFAETGYGGGETELSLVFTDDAAIRSLNAGWRNKDKPTNVLSFPAFPMKTGAPLPPMLGDIVVAFETVAREAELESKSFDHHLTHLVVHGLLHLIGHDHEDDAEAETMEGIERRALARLAIPDPYAVDEV